MQKLDSNRAWKEATAAVSANRDVMGILAAVFFFLPSLALSLLFPQPEPPAGIAGQEAMNFVMNSYSHAAPLLIVGAVVQTIGMLALLTLFTDRRRPTVKDALAKGARAMPSYLAVQILVGVAAGLAFLVALMLTSMLGAPVLGVILITALAVVVLYFALRVTLAAPVIAVEGERNPIAALRRAWHLSQGNAARIGLFFLLMLVAFLVVLALVMMLVGVILAILTGGELQRALAAVASSALGAVMTLYFIAALAAVHRQLAGPSPETIGAAFD